MSHVSKVATTFPNATPPPTDAQRVLNKGYLVSSQEPNKSNVLDVNFASFMHTASNPLFKTSTLVYVIDYLYKTRNKGCVTRWPCHLQIKNIS